jgi:hypothetical protein
MVADPSMRPFFYTRTPRTVLAGGISHVARRELKILHFIQTQRIAAMDTGLLGHTMSHLMPV